ncbi:conserved hypothetical protein [Vibrio mimicus VM603]|uniref:Uncharacterized protein n=1 Tax=Vibrio mimicus VM603 TaxID=671074 RepID=D2YJ91_VIBMI|nr:conserved hypothetical protein [Vibrio mimicus VM603]
MQPVPKSAVNHGVKECAKNRKASGILKTHSTSPNTVFSTMKSAANLGVKVWMKNPKATGQPKKQVRTLNIVCCEKESPRAHLALGNKFNDS